MTVETVGGLFSQQPAFGGRRDRGLYLKGDVGRVERDWYF